MHTDIILVVNKGIDMKGLTCFFAVKLNAGKKNMSILSL